MFCQKKMYLEILTNLISSPKNIEMFFLLGGRRRGLLMMWKYDKGKAIWIENFDFSLTNQIGQGFSNQKLPLS